MLHGTIRNTPLTLPSLPGAIGMYLLSLGVAQIGETLPGPVYGLLSGLNAATVGIIALAAVQLASKAITDPLTRVLLLGGACAGICYSALWYFPVIMVVGGLAAVVWDVWVSRIIGKMRARFQQKRQRGREQQAAEEAEAAENVELREMPTQAGTTHRRTNAVPSSSSLPQKDEAVVPASTHSLDPPSQEPKTKSHEIAPKLGIAIIVAFFRKSAPKNTKSSFTNDQPQYPSPPSSQRAASCPPAR